ncbi:MAG TPA: DUF1801 domain-containing protein [Cyclobacteriaceae bacterium]|jgi:hypothetical protein|nr:DUF1801 domain-containing protein [Cyclobacteriaceae bacterium]HQQ83396.1 DUF1801 domain-containing protein [Cyclobacteriaceae bacterium]
MAKNQNKTTETAKSVSAFLDELKDEARRDDAFGLVSLMKKVLKVEPKMWGPSIVGFGSYHYKYDSGREGDGPLLAFSPRASSFAIYLSANFEKREELLAKLGKVKSEKGCFHIKKLSEVDLGVLEKMMVAHVKHVKKLYP